MFEMFLFANILLTFANLHKYCIKSKDILESDHTACRDIGTL